MTLAEFHQENRDSFPVEKVNNGNKGIKKAYKAQKRKEAVARQALEKAAMEARKATQRDHKPSVGLPLAVFERGVKELIENGPGVDF